MNDAPTMTLLQPQSAQMTFILRILVIDKVTASVHEEIIVEEQHLARLLHKFKDQITFQSCL